MNSSWGPATNFSIEESSLSDKPLLSISLLRKRGSWEPSGSRSPNLWSKLDLYQRVNGGSHENMQFKPSAVGSMLD